MMQYAGEGGRIHTRGDLHDFLRQDAAAHGVSQWKTRHTFTKVTLYFQRVLRYVEFCENAPRTRFRAVLLLILKVYFRGLSIWLGFTIPPNTFGPGLAINHWGTIVVSPAARIGRGCRINVCVNIGLKDGLAPRIGDRVYIGPGAKIFGGITIGNDVQIGANAVVNRSFPDGVVVAGVPARVIVPRSAE